jgi:hypothetical protein
MQASKKAKSPARMLALRRTRTSLPEYTYTPEVTNCQDEELEKVLCGKNDAPSRLRRIHFTMLI